MIILKLIFSILAITVILLANDTLSTCKKIEDNNTRLKCYDNLANKDTNTTITSTKTNNTKKEQFKTKWTVTKDIDPLTDKKIIVLNLVSDNTIYPQMSYNGINPTLIVRCQNNKTETYIAWDTYLGIDYTTVTYRFDKLKKKRSRWGLSTDYKATFAPKGYSFAKQMLKHNKLVANVTPYGDNPVTVTFDLRGFKDISKELRKECKWK